MSTAAEELGPVATPEVGAADLLTGVQAEPLGRCVEQALRAYLAHMDGHPVDGLYQLVIEEVERPLFDTVLQHTAGNLTVAARMLGLTRSTLRKRLAHYGIER